MNSVKIAGLDEYYKNVKNALRCPAAEKIQIITALESNVSAYLEEYPDAGIHDILSHFGEPELFAREYIAALDEDEVAKKLAKAKTFRKWLLIIGVAIVLIVVAAGVWVIIENSTTKPNVIVYETVSDDGIIYE